MPIFKENCIFFQNLPENVTNLNVFFEICVFNLPYIKLSSYIKEQIKLHNFIGGGVGVRRKYSSKIWL